MMHSEAGHVIDIASVGIILSSFFDFLPHIAALLSVIWFALRIYGELVDRGLINGKKQKPVREDP